MGHEILNSVSAIGMGGNVEIAVIGEDGANEIRRFLESSSADEPIPQRLMHWRARQEFIFPNKMVKSGRIQHRDNLLYPKLTATGYTPEYIAIGTDGTAVADAQETLTEVFRKAVTRRLTGEASGNPEAIWQLFIDTTEANGNTLKEAGIFTLGAGGKLWARVVYTGIAKTSASAVTMNWRMPIVAV